MSVLEKICNKLGKANLPVYTVVAVAIFKGILRPTFTMMDKAQDSGTKKYAAVREGSTELIAIPTYITMSYLSQKLAPLFVPKGLDAGKAVSKLENAKTVLGFGGVAIAAVYAIPKLCNVAMPTIMKVLKLEPKKNESSKKLDISSTTPQVSNNADVKKLNNPTNTTFINNTPFKNFNGGLKI